MRPEQLLSDLIKIKTVNPPGQETAAALYLKEVFAREGLRGEIIEPEEGRGSFLVTLGEGDRRLLYLSHLDVVPPGDGWDFDPFSGEIRDGLVLGRGALDCKGQLAAQAAAVIQLAREKYPLRGTLVLAATADEEAGGALGVKHIMDRYPEKLQADLAVNEGAPEPILVREKMVNFIQVGEKGVSWSQLTARGRSCHGSVPGLGDNAILKMAGALQGFQDYRPEIKLIPEVKYLLTGLAPLYGGEELAGKGEEIKDSSLDLFLDSLEDRSLAESLRAITRMTVSPNIVQGGEKVNIVPELCKVELDIRILPGQDKSYVLGELGRVLGNEIEIDITVFHSPTFSPSLSPGYRLIQEVTRDIMGEGVISLPTMSAGATDSRYLRGTGMPVYGVGHMAPGYDPEIRDTIHGRNERIDLDSLHLKTRFYRALAQRYLG